MSLYIFSNCLTLERERDLYIDLGIVIYALNLVPRKRYPRILKLLYINIRSLLALKPCSIPIIPFL